MLYEGTFWRRIKVVTHGYEFQPTFSCVFSSVEKKPFLCLLALFLRASHFEE